ncbi:hypothetical protein ACPA9J_04260 [Pseudomonas aeruginosa]
MPRYLDEMPGLEGTNIPACSPRYSRSPAAGRYGQSDAARRSGLLQRPEARWRRKSVAGTRPSTS